MLIGSKIPNKKNNKKTKKKTTTKTLLINIATSNSRWNTLQRVNKWVQLQSIEQKKKIMQVFILNQRL